MLTSDQFVSILNDDYLLSDNFDAASWMMVSLVGINASAFSIFIFEWLSPAGHDRKVGRFTFKSTA